MEFIGAILLAHLVGDYILQSHYQATEKTKRWWPAITHGITYTLPFLFITQSPLALLVIAGTHIIIDRYRLAKYVVWAKNQLAPKDFRFPWKPKAPKAPKSVLSGLGELSIYTSYPSNNTIRDTSKDNNPNTGFPNDTPAFLAFWLLILADNIIHLLINLGAVLWL